VNGSFNSERQLPTRKRHDVHQETLKEVVGDLGILLPGRFLGKIFQLSELSLALDFGLRNGSYLFMSIDPAAPRLYLIKRSVRELEKASIPLSPFAQAMRTSLGGGNLISVTKDGGERIVRFSFSVADDLGDSGNCSLVAQLTGRSANLLLLDQTGIISRAWRSPKGEGQQIGDLYRPPNLQAKALNVSEVPPIVLDDSPTISDAADKYYQELELKTQVENLAGTLVARLQKEISRRKKLQANLNKDLVAHGNPEKHKRLGDLLLANLSSATRSGNKVTLIDYYAEETPLIEIEVDENKSLQEAASEFFSRYAKAKRAVEEIGGRLFLLDQDLKELAGKRLRLESVIASGDVSALGEFEERKTRQTARTKKEKASLTIPGVRRYRSSDGYEVLVGRTARDNDQLTFRIARANDLWLHAGDYPGSHVIVRNSSRTEVPQRTVIEAAQLAAKFSQASKDSKVSIHYALRKFLTKPKGAAPGLVRMSRFKTITVEPSENIERIK